MRRVMLFLWAGLAWGDASLPSDGTQECLRSIDKLAAKHPERRWHKSLTNQRHILFQALGPEEKGGIFVTLHPERPEADTAWLDIRHANLVGNTPEAAWTRTLAHHFASITVWHTDLSLVPEVKQLLDACMQ